ncbi:MAG: hypothetical protein ACREA4_12980 [Nitrososphaera sp.]
MKKSVLAILALGLPACALVQPQEGRIDRARLDAEIADRIASARIQAEDRKVNENWSVHCTVDQVTTLRRCYAGTFSQYMSHDGKPYG